jgi:RimJ/RimL family protein N-acetyltransferase
MSERAGAATALAAGERLYLREIRLSDVGEAYHRWLNDPLVTRYTESRFFPSSMDALREYVARFQNDRQNLFVAIVLRQDDRHIGNIKLGPINWIHRTGDIGIIIGERDCWGHGYASEAIRLLTDYAFGMLNLRRVTAGCYATNVGSYKAFLKAGWREESVRPRQYWSEGAYVDEILLGLERPGRHDGS